MIYRSVEIDCMEREGGKRLRDESVRKTSLP